ncbi:MAG: toxin-antitoxin system YwqK family antitoxin [Bacteroidota bacterium]
MTSAGAYAQNDSLSLDKDSSITLYDAFNPVTGGDSVRMCNGQPCMGLQKDYYANGELKHKGYYNKGKLTPTYRNYFSDGKMEREFKEKNANKAELKVYYPDGQLRSNVSFWKGEPLEWKEYYSNGELEFYELMDKGLEHVVQRTYYYPNGNRQSHLELTDKKTLTFTKTIYYENGVAKEKGSVVFNPYKHAYFRTGEWIFFDQQGNPEVKQSYVKDKVISEEQL